MNVRYHPSARAELLAAAEWYETRRPGLGRDCHSEVKHAEQRIRERPLAWQRWPGIPSDVRRFVLARFPYSLAYQLVGDDIVMIAVAHQRRAPFYWRDRAP